MAQPSSIEFLGFVETVEKPHLVEVSNRKKGVEWLIDCQHTFHFRVEYGSHHRYSGIFEVFRNKEGLLAFWKPYIRQVEGYWLNGNSYETDSIFTHYIEIPDSTANWMLNQLGILYDCKGDSCFQHENSKSWCLHGDHLQIEVVKYNQYTHRLFVGCSTEYDQSIQPTVDVLFDYFRTDSTLARANDTLWKALPSGTYTNGYFISMVTGKDRDFLNHFRKLGTPASE